ncbi:MAG: NAD(P)/FAD-dependent oxidoreductase [Methanocellales archaeon]|nr:NAD(P)/FAD-dependent oxidoreductase [Methanocellales archaeon]MDD3421041.1 NAD(P)/FAD-dependent oxidoreductase [Methanocellales archaeon]MDD5447253.1 NAD(P)/FAD-dependent oxidoreductase [Methanocellales archaeon]
MQNKKHIIIVGAGYAGLHAARKLSSSLSKDTSITLIDKNEVHVRLSEIYEVAVNRVEPRLVATPIKKYVKRTSFLKGEVKKIDFIQRKVSTDTDILNYDYLILAVGSEPEFFKIPGTREHSFPLWNLEDAKRIKDHIEGMFVSAQEEQDAGKIRELLNFVVCCGGLTGIEVAGEMAEWFVALSRKYNISKDQVNLILVEALADILPTFRPSLVDKSKRILRLKGVQIMVNSPITRVSPNYVELKSGEKLMTRTSIWAAGICANRIIDSLGLKTFGRNRIGVNKYLQVTDHPEVYAIGDCAYFTTDDGTPLPQFVEAALQTADCAVHNIIAEIKGKSKKEYRPKIHGTVVSIGSKYAVADIVGLPFIGGLTFSGFLAMLLKHLFNIYYVIRDLGDVGLAFEYIYSRVLSNRR